MSQDTKERNVKIRQLHAAGWNQSDIAQKYGLNPGHVSRICRYRTELDDPQEAAKQLRLQDQSNYYRNRLKEGLRNEEIIRHCAEIAVREVKPFSPVKPPSIKRQADKVQETLVVLNSDGHHDQVVRSEEVNGLEHYTFPVSLRRGERFVDQIIKYATRTLRGYQFNRLVVMSLGDSTSGEIHDAERVSAFGNQFKNDIAIGTFHAAMYRDLAKHFAQVDVICTSGNHGRRTNRKEYKDGAHNNHDYIINKIAQQSLREQENIKFHIPNSWDTVVDIEGFGFHCSHGDDVANTGGNPWNGLNTLHKTNSGIHRGSGQAQPFRGASNIDYYCIGHHHTVGQVDGNGVGFICNGAWVGTDSYAYQRLRVAGRPQQLIFGVHKDHGKTWSLPIHLDGRDNSATCRYDSVMDVVDGLEYCLNAPRRDEI